MLNNTQEKQDTCCKSCSIDHLHNCTSIDKHIKKEKKTFKEVITSIKVRLISSLILFVVGLILSFTNHSFESDIVLYVAYIIIGYSIVIGAIKNLFSGHILDEKFLMSIASIGAFGVGQVSEGVAVMIFYMVGETFNDYAMNNSKKSIAKLMELKPDIVHIVKGNSYIDVEPNSAKINDIIIIKAGERVPLDSIVIKGQSTLNTSAITGESLPVDIKEESRILSGSVNGSGIIKAKVTKTFNDSTFSRIIKMVENSSNKKAKSEKFISKFSKYYTPIVVVLATLTTIIPTLLFGQKFETWFYRSLMFLVVSCPCALVLSVPLTFFGGIGAAAKNGILIKGGSFIELLSKVDTFVFDKTGTLTEGNFSITDIITYNYEEEKALKYAAIAESNSSHPIAISIVKEYLTRNNLNHIDEIEMDINEEFGKGIKATIQDKHILIGSSNFLKNNNICVKSHENKTSTVVQLAIDGEHISTIYVGDTLKKESKKSLNSLKKMGIKKLIMLSGDQNRIASEIGEKAGIDEVQSQLLPQDKVVKLEEIMNKSNITAFVGDGINDAPSIARADIGISMGTFGSDAAIEASDIVLIGNELSGLPKLIKLSKKTLHIAKQNIIFALSIKILIMVLAIFGMGNMWIAVFGDVGVSILAVLNSLRMIRIKNL